MNSTDVRKLKDKTIYEKFMEDIGINITSSDTEEIDKKNDGKVKKIYENDNPQYGKGDIGIDINNTGSEKPHPENKDKNIFENDEQHHGTGDIDINVDAENNVDKYEIKDINTYENGNLENDYSDHD